jgi:hypothetical protein
MMAFHNKSTANGPASRSSDTANHSKTPKSSRVMVSSEMMEQLDRARAAVKETASIIKAQRLALSSDSRSNLLDSTALLSPIPMRTCDLSQSSSQYNVMPASSAMPPPEITTSLYSQVPSRQHQTMSAERVVAATPSFDGKTNLRMQLEEEHLAEKSAIKTKYRERIRCMRKEWEGERKAILSLIASPVETSEGAYRIVKSPVNNRSDSVPRHVMAKEMQSSCCDTETIDSSYLETETFVMNILQELDEN